MRAQQKAPSEMFSLAYSGLNPCRGKQMTKGETHGFVNLPIPAQNETVTVSTPSPSFLPTRLET
jgi:hypothetical protein